MLKVKLLNLEVSITVGVTPGKREVINLKDGIFKDAKYNYLIVTDGKLILEGDTYVSLFSNYDFVIINVKSAKDKLAEYFSDVEIYVDGIDAIPEERYKEALEVVLS